ncbi:MAG: hypothetical protein ABSH36_05080 [Solirubrobacteraceae bacterium]
MNPNQFDVDYNDRDREGRLMASMRFAAGNRIPEPGESVWTADDEGHTCRGTVSHVEGSVVYIDLDRSTWRVFRAVGMDTIEDDIYGLIEVTEDEPVPA